VPDEVVNEMMRSRLSRRDCEGFVLDGYPRTVHQAHALDAILAELNRPLCVAIDIEVPDEAIVERRSWARSVSRLRSDLSSDE
jgi:adenylate kinase